jgi:hypothetical protein
MSNASVIHPAMRRHIPRLPPMMPAQSAPPPLAAPMLPAELAPPTPVALTPPPLGTRPLLPPAAHPGHHHPLYAPHSHDPDLSAHHYKSIAKGRFALIRTQGGRFYAVIEVMTALGEIHAMLELHPHAATAIAHAQHEHEARQHAAGYGMVTGGGGVFYQDEMTVGAGGGGVFYQDEMTVGQAIVTGYATTTGFDFGDIGKAIGDVAKSVVHTVEHIAAPVAHTVEHIAAPVVHAVTNVANKVAHGIEAAAKTVEHGVSDAVKTAARIVAKAHLGDINAGKFIKDIVHGAEQGVQAARKAADALAQGAQFLARHVDVPKILADAIPIPAIRSAAQSVIGMIDPIGKFDTAIEALRKGDVNKLKSMADQELAEMQGVVSLVPGIGSGISAALGAAEALLHGGAPLEIALRAAYGALPIPPGIRQVTDTVLEAVLQIIKGGDITDAALAIVRDRIPSGMPRDVFDTLVNVIGKHQPITKAAEQLAGHYVTQYTQGLSTALEKGLSSVVAPGAAQVLRQLPDPSTNFASFAPHLKDLSQVASQLQKRIPAPGLPQALPGGVRAPLRAPMPPLAMPRRVLPLHLAMAH